MRSGIVCILGLTLVLSLLSCQRAAGVTGPAPVARDGRIDLVPGDWKDHPVELNGTWRFSAGVFLDPLAEATTNVSVPGNVRFGDSPFGYGTYTLDIRLPATTGPLSLRLPIIGTACEILADGTLLASSGTIAERPEAYTPAYRPLVVDLPPVTGGKLHLSIRVANYDDLFTGIGFPVSLGPTADIRAAREQASLGEALLIGGLFLLGIYHFGFFIFRRTDRTPLWFGIFCTLLALRSTLYSELIFLDWFPEVSWYFIIRGVYLAMVIPATAFLLFVHELYPSHSWRPATRIGLALQAVFGLLVVLAPVPVFTALLVPYQIILALTAINCLVTVGRALAAHERGALLFLIGTVLFALSVGLDIFKNHFMSELPSLVPWGTLMFLLFQGLVLTRRFSVAFTMAEKYSAHLARLNSSLERFIPREVLGFLEKDSIVDIGLGDYTEQRMSVFFLDIRNFTGLSETMTPRENFRFINSFLRRFGPLIREHRGFVDKYLGDGLMALFPGTPEDALRAALAMRAALVDYNEGRVRGGYPTIRFGIGIHTGQLMLGTIGENQRMDSTVISDTVNLASRLEGLTKKFQTDILVSGDTVYAVADQSSFRFEFLAEETVKGRTKPIGVYAVSEAPQRRSGDFHHGS